MKSWSEDILYNRIWTKPAAALGQPLLLFCTKTAVGLVIMYLFQRDLLIITDLIIKNI